MSPSGNRRTRRRVLDPVPARVVSENSRRLGQRKLGHQTKSDRDGARQQRGTKHAHADADTHSGWLFKNWEAGLAGC